MWALDIIRNAEKCWSSSSSTLFLIVVLTIIRNPSIVADQVASTVEEVSIVEVYKCRGSNLDSGLEIPVPSYVFDDEFILRIRNDKAFPGCGSSSSPQEAVNLDFFEQFNTTDSDDLEEYGTSINAAGILNVRNRFYDKDDYCVSEYREGRAGTELPSLQIKYCPQTCEDMEDEGQVTGSDLCIRKCCPPGKVVDLMEGQGYRCEPSGSQNWSPFFYDEVSWKPVPNVSESGRKRYRKPHFFKTLMSDTCNGSLYEVWVNRKLANETLSSTRLLTNGQLIYINAHRSWTLMNNSKNKFCIDGMQNFAGSPSPLYSGNQEDQIVFICSEDIVEEKKDKLSSLYMWSLFVAAGFYLATAFHYLLLWDKQNTHGWTVFSLVLSQFLMCLSVGNAHRLGLYGGPENRHAWWCVSNAIIAHFFMLASFTWLTVINFDLWSTFRYLRHRNHKSVDLKKLSMYSLIGWGAPLVVVIVGVTLDYLFPDRESLVIVPEYGVNICYVATWSQGPYVYYIMAVLLAITMTLSVLTCAKIYEFHKDSAGARSSSNAGDRKMFSLYAKLSVVLGTSWIFEFISWISSSEDHQHWIWVIFDMYNLLTALFIFIIFVCKQTTLTQLAEKYWCLSCLRPINNMMTKLMAGKPSDATASSVIGSQPSKKHNEMKNYGGTNSSVFQSANSVSESQQDYQR